MKECLICGNKVKTILNKYCSKNCYYISIKGKGHPKWKEKTIKKCLICGKEYKINLSKSKNSKYCSRKCYNIIFNKENKKRRGINHPNWKEKITKICILCGNEYKVSLSESKKRQCCSRECQKKYRNKIGFYKGNKNWNWKGGITSIAEIIRHSNKYKTMATGNFYQG